MKNLTITVDDPALEWARIEAARRGTSVSRMVGDFLGEMQRREDAYERAYLAWRTDERTWRSARAGAAAPRRGRGVQRGRAGDGPVATLERAVQRPVFVDTAVLLAAEDGADAALQDRTAAALDLLWQERLGRVSTAVLAQFYASATREAAPPMAVGDARAAIRRYNAWTPWQVDAATLETAWAVEARHALAWADCLALAAAQHSGCASLLSLHLPQGAQYGGVEVWHPLHCVLSPAA